MGAWWWCCFMVTPLPLGWVGTVASFTSVVLLGSAGVLIHLSLSGRRAILQAQLQWQGAAGSGCHRPLHLTASWMEHRVNQETRHKKMYCENAATRSRMSRGSCTATGSASSSAPCQPESQPAGIGLSTSTGDGSMKNHATIPTNITALME